MRVLLLVLMIGACSPGLFSRKSNSSDSKEGSGKTDDQKANDKISDEDAGVPGYLVDPETKHHLERGENDGSVTSITIFGNKGSVVAENGHPNELIIGIYQDELSSFYNPPTKNDGEPYIKATYIGTARPAADGSYEAKVKIASNKILIIAVVGSVQEDEFILKKNADDKPKEAFVNLDKSNSFLALSISNQKPFPPCATERIDGTDLALSAGVGVYVAQYAQSCTNYCASHGGSDDVALKILGNESLPICRNAGVFFCATYHSSTLGVTMDQQALGCTLDRNSSDGFTMSILLTGLPTTPEAAAQNYRRICACKN